MTAYASFAKIIRSQDSIEGLLSLEPRLDRLYNARVFTISEFTKLDCLLIDSIINLEK